MLVPPLVWASRRWPRGRVHLLGGGLSLLGLAGIAVLAAGELLASLSPTLPLQEGFTLERLGFVILTCVDFPAVQLALAGPLCWLARPRRPRAIPKSRDDALP